MAAHQFTADGRGDARNLHPRASIIRHLGLGRYIAFDRSEDARGHETADLAPMQAPPRAPGVRA